jgi:hypothetical protein
VFEGELQQGRHLFQVEFEREISAVAVDRADADEEFTGDLFANLVIADQYRDPQLGLGQRLDPAILRRLSAGASDYSLLCSLFLLIGNFRSSVVPPPGVDVIV